MIGGLVHVYVLISLTKLNNEKRMHMNEYTDYLIQWLIHGNGNFVTAEYLADLCGRDLKQDLKEIFDFYGVEY